MHIVTLHYNRRLYRIARRICILAVIAFGAAAAAKAQDVPRYGGSLSYGLSDPIAWIVMRRWRRVRWIDSCRITPRC